MTQNDYKALMLIIEEKMKEFFEQTSNEKKKATNEIKQNYNDNFDKNAPIEVSIYEEKKSNSNSDKLSVPFAYVGSVMENSPAEEAGLKVNDGISRFDNIEIGKYTDPLIKISDLIKMKKDTQIDVEVMRKTGVNDKIEFLKLKLIPHLWSGQGLLGCKLTLENK